SQTGRALSYRRRYPPALHRALLPGLRREQGVLARSAALSPSGVERFLDRETCDGSDNGAARPHTHLFLRAVLAGVNLGIDFLPIYVAQVVGAVNISVGDDILPFFDQAQHGLR